MTDHFPGTCPHCKVGQGEMHKQDCALAGRAKGERFHITLKELKAKGLTGRQTTHIVEDPFAPTTEECREHALRAFKDEPQIVYISVPCGGPLSAEKVEAMRKVFGELGVSVMRSKPAPKSERAPLSPEDEGVHRAIAALQRAER